MLKIFIDLCWQKVPFSVNVLSSRKFDDTKVVIRTRISKTNKQCLKQCSSHTKDNKKKYAIVVVTYEYINRQSK